MAEWICDMYMLILYNGYFFVMALIRFILSDSNKDVVIVGEETLRNVGEAAAALLGDRAEQRRLSRRTGTTPNFDFTYVPSHF